jgi:predicted kinase
VKRLILLVGIPGSGKTTLARKLIEKGYTAISADSIREELYGDEGEQGEPQKVFAIFFERLEKILSTGADVVVDNTNLKAQYRQEISERAKPFGYENPQIWVLDIPLNVCLKRNSLRDRKVGDDIVTNMFNEFNRNGRPKNSEGKIVVVRAGENENDFRFFYPERTST